VLLCHPIVIAAIIVAGVLAYTISKSSDGNPAKIMQVLLYVFVGVLIVRFRVVEISREVISVFSPG
jgi:hypothetical protein